MQGEVTIVHNMVNDRKLREGIIVELNRIHPLEQILFFHFFWGGGWRGNKIPKC